MMKTRWQILIARAAPLAALGMACGSPPPATPPPAPTAAALGNHAPSASPPPAPVAPGPVVDVCAESKPVPHPYLGLLGQARCDQEMFLTMASVADQLGVECKHCHAPHPTDKKKEDYPVMTPKKEVANWMSQHLMSAIKPVDGSQLKCKSCHTDENGKPVAKILGNPRDPVKAQEWMSLVMVNKFVTNKGEKLKCKSCHGGNFTTKEWQAKVILKTEQIPRHEPGGGVVRSF